MSALPAMRAELQAQFSATEDPMQRAMLQDALVSMESVKESDVKTVGSVGSSDVTQTSIPGGHKLISAAVVKNEQKYPYRQIGPDEYAVDPVRLRALAVELGSPEPTQNTVNEYMRRAEAENKPPPKANQGFRLTINLKDYTREQAIALGCKISTLDNLDLDVEVTRAEWDDSDDDDVEDIVPEPAVAMSQLE